MRRDTRAGLAWMSGQLLLFALVALAALLGPDWPSPSAFAVAGSALMLVGAVLAVWAGGALGPRLTPFPAPRGPFVASGPYRLARHPIYGGVLLLALGGSLLGSPLALVPTAALAVYLGLKSRLEERLLLEADSGYAAYRAQVRSRFLPGL